MSFSSCSNINEVLSGEQEKRIHYSCESGIEKSVPRDHRLSTGDPRDGFLYPTLTLMKDSYITASVKI